MTFSDLSDAGFMVAGSACGVLLGFAVRWFGLVIQLPAWWKR